MNNFSFFFFLLDYDLALTFFLFVIFLVSADCFLFHLFIITYTLPLITAGQNSRKEKTKQKNTCPASLYKPYKKRKIHKFYAQFA